MILVNHVYHASVEKYIVHLLVYTLPITILSSKFFSKVSDAEDGVHTVTLAIPSSPPCMTILRPICFLHAGECEDWQPIKVSISPIVSQILACSKRNCMYIHILLKPVLDANTCASIPVSVKAPPLHLSFFIHRLLEKL